MWLQLASYFTEMKNQSFLNKLTKKPRHWIRLCCVVWKYTFQGLLCRTIFLGFEWNMSVIWHGQEAFIVASYLIYFWCSCGTPHSGSGGLWLFCLLLGLFPTYWVASIQLWYEGLCLVLQLVKSYLLISLGGLLFWGEKQRRSGSGGEERLRKHWEEWREGKLVRK